MKNNTTPYFSHDSNARHDPKHLKLRIKHGWKGYGMYWAILEIMRDQEDYKLNQDDVESLSLEFNTSVEEMVEFITDCIDYKLFNTDGEKIWSDTFLKRMHIKDVAAIRKKVNSLKGHYGNKWTDHLEPWELEVYENGTSALQLQDNSQTAVDKSKGKKRKYKPCPYKEIQELWNTTVKDLPKVKELSYSRKKNIKTVWRKYEDIDKFKEVFTKTQKSDWLKGECDKSTWKASFDWVMQHNSFIKISEGNYDNNSSKKKGGISYGVYKGED